MGVFSRTMLMLTLAWLVGLLVTFIFMSTSKEPSWREKFIAEANIRRAIAYRYVDIKGGIVAERGHDKGPNPDETALTAESLGAAPFGLPDEGAAAPGGTDPLPGAKVSKAQSLIDIEKGKGAKQNDNFTAAKQQAIADITSLREAIAAAQRDRRVQDARLAEVREAARMFAAEMQSYRYIIASFQQKVFNLDYEIQRAMIERDALKAELAQVENDIMRLDGQQLSLEDSYYDTSKNYEKTIKILALYEVGDKNLRLMADTAGRGWLRGKVVAVGDDPNTGVVSISLGSNEGVFEGQAFSIFRDDSFVGRMVVENVRANVAVGRLAPEFRGKRIVLNGDNVKTAEPYRNGAMRR
ncbi:MAG: hypothetical protein H6841_01960 [Planctomycetes bacterium]|nr:hypothetical protein [Planctomycetota bacterium]MCB9935175.1 hypothetical protein [Planctomycetota bacterium]